MSAKRPITAVLAAPILALCGLSVVLGGCLGTRLPLGDQCELSSECQNPLVCSLARCRRQCATTRDCPIGSLCTHDENGVGVCLLPDEGMCVRDSDCASILRCIAGTCTEACAVDTDCAPGAICVGAPAERHCINPAGASCVRSDQCEAGLICARDGRCGPPCRANRDCDLGAECVGRVCVLVAVDGGVRDGGMSEAGPVDGGLDASVDGATMDAATDGGIDAGAECTTPSDCVAPNVATADCVAGRCTVSSCTGEFDDCDTVFGNGCEIDLRTDVGNCGVCGGRCGLGGVCTTGACDTVVDVAIGLTHVCVTRSSGAVWCMGKNDDGQLGRNTRTANEPMLAPIMMLSDATASDPGAGSTCAVRSGGGAVCMGDNAYGQLGSGSAATQASLPQAVTGLSDVMRITAGGDLNRVSPIGPPGVVVQVGFACALRSGGAVSCWGNALYRGDGGATDSNVPVAVTALTDAIDVAAGQRHICAVRASGAVVCWGTGGPWRGPAGSADSGVPVAVAGISDGVRVDASTIHTCVVRSGGAVTCFGSSPNGQLGADLGAATMSATPVAVAGIGDATDIDVGELHSCALRAGGVVSCWGNNLSGELGDGTTGAGGFTPVVATGLTARAISVGRGRSCAIRTDGALACWGGPGSGYGVVGDSTDWIVPTVHPDFPATPVP